MLEYQQFIRNRSTMKFDLRWLFETQALQIAPANQPFWYTSGLIGPYYIHTEYLCGGKKQAESVLELINQQQSQPETLAKKLPPKLKQIQQQDEIYRNTIIALADLVKEQLPFDEINAISGGQRRDWFFAPLVAKELNKPCIYLMNDLRAYDEYGKPLQGLEDKTVLNIADLLTIGSSYTQKWVPAIQQYGGKLIYSLNVVDRNQGGKDNLNEVGVQACLSLATMNQTFFEEAEKLSLITSEQKQLLIAYLNDPHTSMKEFLLSHTEFLGKSLKSSNSKTRERAQKLLQEDYYQLGGFT